MTNTTIKGLLITLLLCGCGEAIVQPFDAPRTTEEMSGPSGGSGQADEDTGGVSGVGGMSGAGGASGGGGEDDDIRDEDGAGGEDEDSNVDDDA